MITLNILRHKTSFRCVNLIDSSSNVFIIRDKERTKEDRTQSKTSISGHGEGDPRPGQTHKKTKDLCPCDREDRGCGEGGVGVYDVSVDV